MKNFKLRFMPVIIAIATITIIPMASPEILAQTDDFTDVIRERNDDKTIDNPDKIIKTPDFVFEGQTEGWAFVENEAHKAFLSLEGDATFNSKNNVWKVKSNSELSIGETNAKIELKGKVKDSKLRLNGSGELEDGTPFRIILRGYFVPIENIEHDYVVAFKTVIISTTDERQRIPVALVGQVNIDAIEPLFVDAPLQNKDAKQ